MSAEMTAWLWFLYVESVENGGLPKVTLPLMIARALFAFVHEA